MGGKRYRDFLQVDAILGTHTNESIAYMVPCTFSRAMPSE